MRHLYWHKPRLVVLGPKIEELPDDHRSKPRCLFQLSRLFELVGHYLEGAGDDFQVAQTFGSISNANRLLGLHKEGIQQVEDALDIYKQLNETSEQARPWKQLATLLYNDNQLDATEKATSRAIDLLSDNFRSATATASLAAYIIRRARRRGPSSTSRRPLGSHSFNRDGHLCWINYSLADLFFSENRLDDAHAHIERAELYAINNSHSLGRVMGQ